MNDKQVATQASFNQALEVRGESETASTSVAVQARAIIEARYLMAIAHPRNWDTVREKLLKECRRPGFAAVARYNKPVGGGIKGPSIRFAEAAIRCSTNVDVSIIVVFDDREKRIARIMVCDIESNVVYSQDITVMKTVERRKSKPGDTVIKERFNSNNEKLYIIEATDDDILNKQNALISKAVRTLGLRQLPGDILEECMDEVIKTQMKKDAEDPNAAKHIIFDSFGEVGVQVKDLQEYLGHPGETLTPKELTDLRGLFSALKDGETTWREIMDSKAAADNAPPKNTLFAKKTSAAVAEQVNKPAKQPENPPQAAPTSQTPVEPTKDTPEAPAATQGPVTRESKLAEVLAAFPIEQRSDLYNFFVDKKWLSADCDLKDMGASFVDRAHGNIDRLKELFEKWVSDRKAAK